MYLIFYILKLDTTYSFLLVPYKHSFKNLKIFMQLSFYTIQSNILFTARGDYCSVKCTNKFVKCIYYCEFLTKILYFGLALTTKDKYAKNN